MHQHQHPPPAPSPQSATATVVAPGITAITQAVTLRTLVNDLIGPSSPSSSSDAGGGTTYGGVTITSNCIVRAVQSSHRNINRCGEEMPSCHVNIFAIFLSCLSQGGDSGQPGPHPQERGGGRPLCAGGA